MRSTPKKSLGQHFLVDENILGVIGRLAELAPEDVVLEVGPGVGVLTDFLAKRVARVVAVELEGRSSRTCADSAATSSSHFGDALQLDLASLAPDATKLVANLPYNIATPLLVESLDGLPHVERWCVMVQREVADRCLRRRARRRTALCRCSCSSSASAPASIPSRARCSGRRRTSTPRSSPSAVSGSRMIPARSSRSSPLRSPTAARLAELARARRARLARRCGRGARRDRPRCASRAEALEPREFVALDGGARVRASAPAKINLALVVGPPREDGKHELADGLPAHRHGRPDRRRTGRAHARRRLHGGHARARCSRAARCARAAERALAREDREAHSRRRGARRR